MTPWPLLIAAALLSLERACYAGITRSPGGFRRLCARPPLARLGEPVAIVRRIFCGFKALQLAVFAGWCWVYRPDLAAPPDAGPAALALGAVLIAAGQLQNVGNLSQRRCYIRVLHLSPSLARLSTRPARGARVSVPVFQ